MWFDRSIAIFCSESTEYFPSMASKYFFKTYVAVPVVPVITGLILRYMFHIFSSLIILLLLLLLVVVVVVINKNYDIYNNNNNNNNNNTLSSLTLFSLHIRSSSSAVSVQTL